MATASVQPNRSQKQRVLQAPEKAPAPTSSAHAAASVKASSVSHAHEKVRVVPGVQHSASNQAMQRMVRGRVLQRKLAINRPGDIYEQEADRVADVVMRMPASAPTLETVRESGLPSRLQRCSCGKPVTSGEQCEACKTQGAELQRSSTTSSENTFAPPIVHDVLNSAGRPLDAATRQFMEPRFGHDFSNVRVHTGSQAAESARAVNALAYTVGNNVVFGSGQYAPSTQAGGKLLAHELAHTLQQESQEPGQLSRKCGPQGFGPTPKDCNLIQLSAADQPKGQRFLFNVNCDDFAPGEQAKLEDLLDPKTLQSNDTIEIVGLASFDGDASFNEALSCGRAAAAVKLITQKGFGSNIKSVGAAGGVAGTTHDATFRAVDVLIKKGKQDPVCNIAGTPKSSATPDLQEVVTTLQAVQFMGDFVLDAKVACQAAQPSDYDDWQVGVVQTAVSPIHERCFKFPAGVTPPSGHLHPTDTFVANLAKMPSLFISDRDDTDPIFTTSTDKTDLSTVHGSNTAITVPVHSEDHPRMGAINHLNSLTQDSNDSQVDLFHQHKFALMLTHVILRNKADSRVIPLFLVGWEFFTNYNYDPSPGTGIPPTSHKLNHFFGKLLEGPATASSPQPVIGGPSLRSFDRPKFDGNWGNNCPIPQIKTS
ncbi:MAG: eCIS core domain-containing protein [Candidatus Angelobacter sp.]